MNARTLVRNERLKTLKRPAFWVTVAGLAVLLCVAFFGDYAQRVRQGDSPRTLPDAWGWIISDIGPVAAIFASVVLMMLVANEFSWRTARQNVIDGLSKERWFLAKLMLVPALAIGFAVFQLAIGGGVALLPTLGADGATSWIGGADLAQMGGFILGTLGICGLAFLSAMLFRSAGAAIGIFFLYIAVIENLIGVLLRRTGTEAAAYTPMNVFGGLSSRGLWEAGPDPARAADPTVPILVGLGWITLFAGGAFVNFMRRDL